MQTWEVHAECFILFNQIRLLIVKEMHLSVFLIIVNSFLVYLTWRISAGKKIAIKTKILNIQFILFTFCLLFS